MNLKGSRRKRMLSNLMHYPGICVVRGKPNQNNQSPNQDLNPGPLEYNAGVRNNDRDYRSILPNSIYTD